MSDFIDEESVNETIEIKITERIFVGCGLYCTCVSYKNNRIIRGYCLIVDLNQVYV